MATNADIEIDDVLTTSGVDGVYPPGIPVAKVVKIERSGIRRRATIYVCPGLMNLMGRR
jgi:rod shape-determining protein MreC